MSIVTVGIDLAKNVFAVHGVDDLERRLPAGNCPLSYYIDWSLTLRCRHWLFGIQPYIAHNGPMGFHAGQPAFAQNGSVSWRR